jgi:hypothetical protein
MKTFYRFLPPATLLLALVSASCNRAVVWVTTTPAPWSYVERSWGGIAVGNPTMEAGRVALPFSLFVHHVERVDSAICVRRATGRVEKGRVLIRLDKSICEAGHRPRTAEERANDSVVHLGRPAPGRYAVVYDDAGAGFPRIGEVEVR